MRLIKLKKTCESCPTQWSFITESYCEGYLRYRFGKLEVYISEPHEKVKYDDDEIVLWMRLEIGSLDGTLSDEQAYCALKLMGFTW